MPDAATVLAVTLTVLLAGVVKGVVGLGLPRDQLVQAMGMLFTVSTLALAMALGGQQPLGWETRLLSTGAVLPALLGMALARRLRHRLPELVLRRVFS